MKETNLHKLTISTIIYVGTITAAYSGQGIGGGAPPAMETDQTNLMTLKDAARNGDLIRFVVPGSEPMYLQPDMASIKTYSISAVELESGDILEFFAETEAEVLQQKISNNLARVAGSVVPGTLPITEDDLVYKIQPQIETIPSALLKAGALTNIPE